MPKTLAAKARLEAQLAELEGRQNRITEALDEPLSPDASERATEMEDDQSLEGQALLITREIASVKRALTRIENGTYGECVRCVARLRLNVWRHAPRQPCASPVRAKSNSDQGQVWLAAASH
jgi:DnaK suppressor protein